MDRSQMRDFYCFLHDGNGNYFSFVNNAVVKVAYPNQKPLEFNPSNLSDMHLSFVTNKNYFSGVRAVLINWFMIGDGADILRNVKYLGSGYAAELHLLIIRYNPFIGIYSKYYEGRFD